MSEVAHGTADRCHLLELPPELRLMIHEYLFPRCAWTLELTDTHIHRVMVVTKADVAKYEFENRMEPPKVEDQRPFSSLALLTTCKLIRYEALPVFRENIELIIYVAGCDSRVGRAISSIQDFSAFSSIRHLAIQVLPCCCSEWVGTSDRLRLLFRVLQFNAAGLESLHIEVTVDMIFEQEEWESLVSALSSLRTTSSVSIALRVTNDRIANRREGFREHTDLSSYKRMIKKIVAYVLFHVVPRTAASY